MRGWKRGEKSCTGKGARGAARGLRVEASPGTNERRKLTLLPTPSLLPSYGQLKQAIYRFEKQALAPPPTNYTDEEPSPSHLESASLLAPAASTTTPSTNEKVFTRLLDQELHKITEFYVDKERELLGDLAMLQADVERIEEEASGLSGGGHGVTSGGSDTEDEGGEGGEESDDDEQGVAARTSRLFKGAIETVFSNPSNYDAAKRAGRKARLRRRGSTSRGSIDGGKGKRTRALSNASAASDLLDLEEEPVGAEAEALPVPEGVELPTTPALRRMQSSASKSSPGGGGGRRRESRMGQSIASFGGGEEDDVGEGVWAGKSDWAIDTRIMYKRRIGALYTVRGAPVRFGSADASADPSVHSLHSPFRSSSNTSTLITRD